MMSNNKDRIMVGKVDIGDATIFSPKHTLCFTFHNFEDLPDARTKVTISPFLPCHGYLWRLKLYPGGDKISDSKITYVSLDLKAKHPKNEDFSVKAKVSLFFNDSKVANSANKYEVYKKSKLWGWSEVCKRDSVLKNHLSGQSLVVTVEIQIQTKKEDIWTPSKQDIGTQLWKMSNIGKDTDVTFKVGNKNYEAHQLIIGLNAPELQAIIDIANNNNEIQIDDVEPSIFGSFVHFLYTNDLPPKEDLKLNARSLLKIANRFGCIPLKLLAEVSLAQHNIDTNNVLEMILFADGMCCPLLRETAITYFIAHSSAVMTTTAWKETKASNAWLVIELLECICSNKQQISSSEESTEDYEKESISELRRQLNKRGHEVDGTREMLVKRLKSNTV